ncbi:MAG: type II toxin-antitoxin system HicB family antitoxin [Pyrinomonadaceae bacterium]|nr:type II toxin-antitoxin system HicB family antitoxin [Pyrinomonadaceae bacterium]
MLKTLTATILREDDGFVSVCSELDIASQGDTVEEARNNLREAVELFFQSAHPNEIAQRLNSEIYITPLEVEIGQTA